MLVNLAKSVLPQPLRKYLRSTILLKLYQRQVRARLRGIHRRECNYCGLRGYFRAYGHPPRYDAQCPECGSLERHRHLKVWLDSSAMVSADTRVLHFAPEPVVRDLIRQKTCQFTSADIKPGRGDLVLDIERIDLPDASADLIICSHVLEHVDDSRALAEMFRVLSPGGVAVLLAPVVEGWQQTYENPAIVEPEDRLLHSGQEDHLRYFGADIRARIRCAGFELDEFSATEPFVSRFSLMRGEKVFVARRPQ